MPAIRSAGGLPPGTRMGRYELISRLAMGGMAELYVARQRGIEGFERIVAVKRVLPHLTEDPEFIRMFLDEARIAASLDHPNIAQVTDIDEEGGEYFFAMEYVHGKNLREVLAATPEKLPLGMALSITVAVAAGLHHAHEARGVDGLPLGLVHRDVSPSNVMIAHSGAVKLTDFGIAKASLRTSNTLAGRIKGKVGYMSPEQCRGDAVDRTSDIFTLGILLYELTTGMRAFFADNDFAAMARIARADYLRPSARDPEYPRELERIVARALRKEPAERHATAEAMQVELEAFAEAHGIRLSAIDLARHMRDAFGSPAHPQTLTSITARTHEAGTATLRRRRLGQRVGIGAALAVVVVLGATVWPATPSAGTDAASERDVQRERDEGVELEAARVTPPAATLDPSPAATPDPSPAAAPDPSPAPALDPSPAAASVVRETSEPPPRAAKKAKRRARKPKPDATRPSPYPPGYER